MRIYANCHELMSEITREVLEMGIGNHPHSMQNKNVKDNPEYSTLEITNYSYNLLALDKEEFLFIGDHRSSKWVREEFSERIDFLATNPGHAYVTREELWDPLLNSKGRFDYTYSERIWDNNNLARIMDEARINPDSRQLILPIFSPTDVAFIGGERRIPCSVYYQFLIRKGKLSIVYAQRSADVYTHFGNDVWLAWAMMEYVATILQLGVGSLYHNIGSLHVYNKDIDNLRQCVIERL